MKRIKNIDLLRAGAILYIMLYHCYVLSGQPWQAHTAIHTILTLGGEVGVTLFFLLSGYGIYLSLSSSEERGCLPGWRAFMKKTLHPYHASVLRLRYSSSDFYVNTDVQQ